MKPYTHHLTQRKDAAYLKLSKLWIVIKYSAQCQRRNVKTNLSTKYVFYNGDFPESMQVQEWHKLMNKTDQYLIGYMACSMKKNLSLLLLKLPGI